MKNGFYRNLLLKEREKHVDLKAETHLVFHKSIIGKIKIGKVFP